MNIDLHAVYARHPAAPSGTSALRGVSLALRAGEQVALIGPSGAGKTTLLQVAAAALKPSRGQLLLEAVDPWSLRTAALQRLRGRLFMAPQTPPLPPRQRVITAVLAGRLPAWSLATSLRSLFYPVDIAGAHAALERFDLAEKLFARVDRLSGGERQRVGLARALLAPATLWLIDEPLSALDPTRSEQAISTVTEVARERGITLMATMHQVDTALAHFDRIVGLRDGAVAFDLPTAQVSRDHLARLYAQHEAELHGGAPVESALPPDAPQPAVMHCR
ncbi:ATP-binding cassette domain-containing protein [Roseateles sp.]|uniref:phosphonate ABC transporter ATP-binding protein n=1 Tax=Roseateles sp. TaxID=1971397 RepID=UPI003262F706